MSKRARRSSASQFAGSADTPGCSKRLHHVAAQWPETPRTICLLRGAGYHEIANSFVKLQQRLRSHGSGARAATTDTDARSAEALLRSQAALGPQFVVGPVAALRRIRTRHRGYWPGDRA